MKKFQFLEQIMNIAKNKYCKNLSFDMNHARRSDVCYTKEELKFQQQN